MYNKFIIIITAEKKEKYISRTIKSCLNQHLYKNLRVIVVYTKLSNEKFIKDEFIKFENVIFLKCKIKKKLPTQDQLFKIEKATKYIEDEWVLLLDGDDGIKIGPFGSSITLDQMVDSGYKVYGQENVIRNNFECGKRFINSKKFERLQTYEIIPEDIIITMMGSGTPGKARVVPNNCKKGIMDSHLVRIRIKNSLSNSNFIALIINSSKYIRVQVEMAYRGSTMTGLNSSVLKKFLVCLPQKEEQPQIYDFLQKETKNLDDLISKSKQQINFLQEKRQALITSAVTGKIDVRNGVAA